METERDVRGDGRVARRAILTGGAGALAALAVRALGSAGGAEAATGDPVLAGETTVATSVTAVQNNTPGSTALMGLDMSPGDGSYAIQAQSEKGIGLGVFVSGGNGIYANNSSDANATIYGLNAHGAAGVHGESLGGGYGVHGATTSGSNAAVFGENAGDGAGVTGSGPSRGVHGLSSAGVGVLADGAVALQVNGPAVFERSGLATVLAGTKSVQVTGVALTAQSLVLATVQGRGNTYVQQVVPDPAGSSFVIYVNKAKTNTPVAWFVVN